MNLRSDKRQNIQKELDFSSSPAGEAREVGREEPESLSAVHERKPSQHESIDGGNM
jgi:hypothetical protein